MSSQSVSRVPVKFALEEVGEAEGELIRFLSPRIVDALIRKLPIEGRAALRDGEVYLQAGLRMGAEKPKKTVEKGQLAYWPYADSLSVFLAASELKSPVCPVGRVTSGLDIFAKVKSGTRITVKKA